MKRPQQFCSAVMMMWLLVSSCNQKPETENILTAARRAEQEGNIVEVANLYHELAHRKPRDFEAQHNAALSSIQIDNLKEAREHLEAAVSLEPNSAEAQLNLGVVYVRLDKKEEGEARFKEALRLNPGLVRAYYNLGVLALEANI